MNDRTLPRARRALLGWYRRQRRDLPWRRSRDPYAIWVAEIMLQQTRVDVVVPYYERFLAQYPSVAHLAAARLEDVLRAWAGLGYYTRARSLHAAARRVVHEHAGRVPADLEALRALPGIGRYTAGAIASVAFGQPAPVLDGNVTRVLARLGAMTADVGSAAAQRALWDVATRWAHCATPGDANQALMELGATLCTPQVPQCAACPLARHCRAHGRGIAAALPQRRRPVRGARVRVAAALLRDGSRLLLVRRKSGGLLRDWWEPPTLALRGRDGTAPLRAALRARGGVVPGTLRHTASRLRHGILSHRLEVDVYTGSAAARRAPTPRRHATPPTTALTNLELDRLEWRWVRPRQCATLPLTTLARKVLGAAAAVDSTWEEYLRQDVGEPRTHERRRHPTEDDV